MRTKVLVTLRGGMIEEMYANNEIELVVVDYDLVDHGESPVSTPHVSYYSDEHVGFSGLFTDTSDPVEMEIRDELKRLKF